jgi:Leucine-rich repeat (LRR) protein
MRLCTVSSSWNEMVYESITEIQQSAFYRLNRAWLTDDVLKRCTSLRKLGLRANYQISDAGISNLLNLTSLNFSDAYAEIEDGEKEDSLKVSDNGLSRLTNLTELNLSGNRSITDNGISRLVGLLSLNLFDNQLITDHGIRQLSSLRKLDLFRTALVTAEGIS